MPQESARFRFSLRDFVVVIVGIGVLLALLVPWIQSSREAARRSPCVDNLRKLTIALQNYHDTYKVFPAGAMHAGLNPGGDPPINARLGPSWYYGIDPFTEHRGGGRYDKIAASQRANSPQKSIEFCADDAIAIGERLDKVDIFDREHLRCPASPLPVMETAAGPLLLPSYVAIAGGCDIDPKSDDYQVSGGAPPGLTAPKTDANYRNKFKGTGAAADSILTSSGMLPPCHQVSIADCTDGTSNTMIVAEQSDWLLDRDPASSKKYHGDPGWSVGGTGPGGGWLSGTRRVDPVPKVEVLGGPPTVWGADCWNITTVRYPPNLKRVMGPSPLPGCSENHGINNPLQSSHRGGLLVVMVDGSVQFISEKTALAVLLRLAIRDDGQQVNLGN